MHSSHLIASILHGKWAIEPLFALAQGPAVANFLNKYVDFERQEPDKMSAYALAPGAEAKGAKYSFWDGFERAPAGSVAVIRLKGVLLKDDQYCGPVGTATLGEIIKAAGVHENIAAIVLHIDSPGGTVDGTEALGNIIKSIEKPVVTFVDGLMASAAFWIGSCADEIVASTDTDEIGSVGVMLQFADVQPYWESMNIRFHTVSASTSPDKNKIWEDLRKGKYEEYRSQVLDKLDEKFMNVIRENLPGIKNEHLTGKVFFARDLMNIVVDSIGDLDAAIERAAELAKIRESDNMEDKSGQITGNEGMENTIPESNQSDSTNKQTALETKNNPTINIKTMKQFKHVNAALEVESLEAVDEAVSLNEQQLEALDNKLAGNDAAGLQARLDEANTAIGRHESTISEKEAAISAKDAIIAERDAEIARLKGKAAGDSGTIKTEGDDADLNKGKNVTVVSESDDFETAVTKVSDEYLTKY